MQPHIPSKEWHSFTNKYVRVDKLGGILGMAYDVYLLNGVGYQNNLYLCVQIDPQQLPKTSKFYSLCNKCDMQKAAGGGQWIPPSGSLKVKRSKLKSRLNCSHAEQQKVCSIIWKVSQIYCSMQPRKFECSQRRHNH